MIRKRLALLMSLILVFVMMPMESSYAANNAVAKTPVNANPWLIISWEPTLMCWCTTIGSMFI